MNLTDESVGNLLKLVGIVFGEKSLLLFDLCQFGFVFCFVIFGFVIVKFNRDPFLVMN